MNPEVLDTLAVNEKREILDLIEELNAARMREGAHGDFLEFVKEVWPAFIEGDHHRVMADAFNRIASGELKRLIINMPPRHQVGIRLAFVSCVVSRSFSRQKGYPDGSYCGACGGFWS